MPPSLQSWKKTLAPAIALVRLAPFLVQASHNPALHPILRSSLNWMPLCLFSEPLLWLRMVLTNSSRFNRPDQRPKSFYVPHLNTLPFGEPDSVSKFLEENIASITEEFNQVAYLEVTTPSEVLVDQGVWNTFPLMRSAKLASENIERCPKTWAVVDQCPLLRGMRGGVYFSIIYPGTHILPHCGQSNLKLRYHLTIEEAEGARIRSSQEWRTWRRGKCLILDDSFEHEVIHAGDKRRVVLIVDCWNPELSEIERELLVQLHKIWRNT